MSRPSSDTTPCGQPADSPGSTGCPLNSDQPTFDWAALVPQVVHPEKVAIIEAMLNVGLPMSALDLHRILGDEHGLSHTSYHVRSLAKAGVLEKVSQRQRRGATQKFYVLR
jgi:hypothetical protein